jgi:hypothetical protein
MLSCGAQATAFGAAHVLDCCAKAVFRGAARCASQVLNRGAQAIARGTALLALQVLGRGAQAVAAALLVERRKCLIALPRP